MTDPSQSFERSLDQDEPPASVTPLLRAVWHGLRGDWTVAHEIAQAQHDADGAWVHAWLHRIEGDDANAAYWYRRAGRPVAGGHTRDEGLVIAQVLLRGRSATRDRA